MPSGIAKVKGGSAADLADATIDAFLSPQVQTILANTAFVAPTNTATPTPAGFPDSAVLVHTRLGFTSPKSVQAGSTAG